MIKMDYEKILKSALDSKETPFEVASWIEEQFPQLAESENERIRKQIIYAIKELHVCDKTKRKCIAWLEKQGEQKNLQYLDTSDCVPWSDEQTRRNLINFLKSLGATEIPQASYNRYLSYLEKQGKHKHQYNSRPRYVREEELLGANKQGKCPFSKQELIDKGFAFNQDGNLAYPIHIIEQKIVGWSEEDKRKLDYVCSILRDNFNENDKLDLDFPCMGAMVDWLKSLRPQKQERLEIEVLKCKNDQWVLKVNGNVVRGQLSDSAETIYKNFVYCSEIHPQSQWKPTKEQMEALDTVYKTHCADNVCRRIIFNLMNDLKKLKG